MISAAMASVRYLPKAVMELCINTRWSTAGADAATMGAEAITAGTGVVVMTVRRHQNLKMNKACQYRLKVFEEHLFVV